MYKGLFLILEQQQNLIKDNVFAYFFCNFEELTFKCLVKRDNHC